MTSTSIASGVFGLEKFKNMKTGQTGLKLRIAQLPSLPSRKEERWFAIDDNTYDGASIPPGPEGRGFTPSEAVLDLLINLAEGQFYTDAHPQWIIDLLNQWHEMKS